jgi:esterase/lipase superfamily enzyme
MECLRSYFQKDDAILRSTNSAVSLTIFYATNRRPLENGSLVNFYGVEDAGQLLYGTTTITIPTTHKAGELELPTLWKLELKPDPDRHFAVKAVTPLSTDDAKAQISSALGVARSKSLLLFIHGYNTSFLDASLRTAQLAHDLRFPGLGMFYSWPSAGTTAGYLHDEESSQLSSGIFDQLLDDLSLQRFENIYIIAHSMGNRVVGTTLANRVKSAKDISKVREIMLAAPDINAQLFRSEIAPTLVAITNARKTIYASSNDVALKASSVMHGFARVGDTNGGVFVYSGFDTIDASRAAPLLRSFGHSYVLDSSIVLNDVEDVLVWHRSVSQRVLRQLGVAPNLYWGLR